MNETSNAPYHEVTSQVVNTVRELMVDAKYASMATIDANTSHPLCTRVGLGMWDERTPLIFVSELAPHTRALLADPRCSLMLGEVVKGDPLANARLTLNCIASRRDRSDTNWELMLAGYVRSHPKAKLYAQLADFHFFALEVISATYIAGFGEAYQLAPSHFTSQTLA